MTVYSSHLHAGNDVALAVQRLEQALHHAIVITRRRARERVMRDRQPVGHGVRLDVDFLVAAGVWPRNREILDTPPQRDRPFGSDRGPGCGKCGDGVWAVNASLKKLAMAQPYGATEAVFAARAERLRDPFLRYALPQAALRLKQGFGRLIRRRDDRGAVVILDLLVT